MRSLWLFLCGLLTLPVLPLAWSQDDPPVVSVVPIDEKAVLVLGGLEVAGSAAQKSAGPANKGVAPEQALELAPPARAIYTLDLASALRLAGIENLEIVQARQRVVEAVAARQLAAAQLLPNTNLGLNFDAHNGPLQQASGNILSVTRSALYVGAGTNAVAAGTVSIPGVVYNLNLSEAFFNALVSRQVAARASFTNQAIANEMLRRVAGAYLNLLAAESYRSLTWQTEKDAAEVAKMTAAFAKTGQGRQADADRAATELATRKIDRIEADGRTLIASARLAELLNLDATLRLHPAETQLVPLPVVPELMPLPELVAVALARRPELAERQAAIRQAFLELRSAKVLPFSPNVIMGFSAGTFGGGSNIVAGTGQPRFGNFGGRNDVDVVMYWTLQNLGIGNRALVNAARSRLGSADLRQLEVLNRVRAEVAQAYTGTQVLMAKIASTEKAVTFGGKAFAEDLKRVQGGVGLPIELMDSLRLLGQARLEYLDAIVRYNKAHVDLYVALGQPPADTLARPVPADFSPTQAK